MEEISSVRLSFNFDNEPVFTFRREGHSYEQVNIHQFARIVAEKAGSASRAEMAGMVTHWTLSSVIKGKSKNIMPVLRCAYAQGFTIIMNGG